MVAMLHRNKAHLVKDNHHMGSQAATSSRGINNQGINSRVDINNQGINNQVDINNRGINNQGINSRVVMASSRPMARLLESARLVLAQ